jgi:hypothetical protein
VLLPVWLCACKDTGVIVELSAQPPLTEPVTLIVAGRFGLLAQTSVDGARLPGTLFIRLADDVTEVRVAARAGGRLVAVRQTLRAQEEPRIALKLDRTQPDQDDDGWPDAFDGCPQVADHDQLDSNGDGVGDACAGAGADAGLDAGLDAGSDAGFDAGLDAGLDAGGLDAGFRPKPCSQQNGAVTCIDFESLTDTAGFGDAVAQVVTDVALQGTHSLRISRAAGSQTYAGRWVTVADTSRYLRFYVRLARGSGQLEVLNLQDVVNGHGLTVYAQANVGFEVVLTATSTSTKLSSELLEEQWYCLEFDSRAGADGGVSLSQDEVVLANLAPLDFRFDRALVEASYDVGQGGTLWLDAIVSSNQPIGCQ